MKKKKLMKLPQLNKIHTSLDKPWNWKEYKLNINHKEFYSEELLIELKTRYIVATEYIQGESQGQLAKKYNIPKSSITQFSSDLITGKPLLKIGKSQFDYRGKLGLELAKVELRIFEKLHKKIPTANDESIEEVSGAIENGYWEKFGIESWNDLLRIIFGELNKRGNNYYYGREGLRRAKEKMLNFKMRHNRKPISTDIEMGNIYTALSREYWKEFNINFWNDLLYWVFGEINNKVDYYLKKEELKQTKKKVLQFKVKYKRIPIYTDKIASSIITAINNGYWVNFDIKSWNDFLIYVFGEFNQVKRIYSGKEGLIYAKKLLNAFKEKHGKFPTIEDYNMGGILTAIIRGYWQEFDIYSWFDLKKSVWGDKVNENERKKCYNDKES